MIGYIFIAVLVIAWIFVAYELKQAPTEQNIEDDPTTTCWHDDEHYPDSKL